MQHRQDKEQTDGGRREKGIEEENLISLLS